MKKLLTLSFLLMISISFVFSQESNLNLIENGKYLKAAKKILTGLAKKPDDIILNYSMAILLIQREYKGYDAKQSFDYMIKTQAFFAKAIDKKDMKDLEKLAINQVTLDKNLDHICSEGLADASAVNTIFAYENYINYFYTAPSYLKEKAKASRNIIAFDDACRVNSVQSYQYFINTYTGAVQQNEAKNSRNALAYEIAKSKNTIAAYKEFIKSYPDAAEVNNALARTHELAFVQAEKENTSASYKKFADEYPNSLQYSKAFALYERCLYFDNTTPGNYKSYYQFVQKFPSNSWVTVAMDSLYVYASGVNDWKVLEYCVDKLSGTKRDKALLYFHGVFTNDGETKTLDRFYNEYDEDILMAANDRD